MIATMILNRFLCDSAKYLEITPASRRLRAASTALHGTYGRIARTRAGHVAVRALR